MSWGAWPEDGLVLVENRPTQNTRPPFSSNDSWRIYAPYPPFQKNPNKGIHTHTYTFPATMCYASLTRPLLPTVILSPLLFLPSVFHFIQFVVLLLFQCNMSTHGQRGECWCVNPFTGLQIPSTPKVRGDPNCNQFQEELLVMPTETTAR